MNDAILSRLAKEAGLLEHWTDARQQPQQVSVPTLRAMLGAMGVDAGSESAARDSLRALREARDRSPDMLIATVGEAITLPDGEPARLMTLEDGREVPSGATRGGDGRWSLRAPAEPGYHQLELGGRQLTLAIAPSRCPSPADRFGEASPRRWGIAAQLYSLRQADGALRGACGFGDFAALARLAREAATRGADALAISPVHAGFASAPERYSPYSPSSRLFLNVLYGSAGAVLPESLVKVAWSDMDPGLAVEALEAADRIDWPAAAACRLAFLAALHRRFAQAGDDSQRAFFHFCTAGGQPLRDHATYEGLAAHHGADWRAWPRALQDPRSAEVAGFAAARPQEVDFHLFAQWIASASLGAVQAGARQAGMRIGLIADLAIGTDPRGSQAWSDPGALLAGAAVGAPPDIFNPRGQDWGLTAFSPLALREQGYAPFIRMLRACLAHAGGVRIDHILGLARMWLVPEGMPACDGVYLRYPLQDMLRLIQLEAWRHQAMVIGENLGTVPEGFNASLARSGILGMDVLWFEREAADAARQAPAPFLPPRSWPAPAVAMTTTHDLPTLEGWWRGRDVDWRAQLGQLEGAAEHAAREERAADKAALWSALQEAGLLERPACAEVPATAPALAMLRFVAAAPCPLALFPIEDLAGDAEQPNLPDSREDHPNWRRRMAAAVDHFFDDPDVQARLAAIEQGRKPS